MGVIVPTLFVVTILTKSANAWSLSAMGIFLFFIFKSKKDPGFLKTLILIIPIYIFVRVNNILSIDSIENSVSFIFDPERVSSLIFRLNQEDLFSGKALERVLFGWGGWQRNRPIDPMTGELVEIVDSLWLIIFSTYGAIGLSTLFLSLLSGPWKSLGLKFSYKGRIVKSVSPIALSIVLIFFMIDSLLNGMVNHIYILSAGALSSYYIYSQKQSRDKKLYDSKI